MFSCRCEMCGFFGVQVVCVVVLVMIWYGFFVLQLSIVVLLLLVMVLVLIYVLQCLLCINSQWLLVLWWIMVILLLGNSVDFWKWLMLVLLMVLKMCLWVGKVCSVVCFIISLQVGVICVGIVLRLRLVLIVLCSVGVIVWFLLLQRVWVGQFDSVVMLV